MARTAVRSPFLIATRRIRARRALHFRNGPPTNAHARPPRRDDFRASLPLTNAVASAISAQLPAVQQAGKVRRALFFTGDITQCGASEEFKRFDEILRRIQEKLAEAGSTPFFLAVPGNHDLTRPDPQDPIVYQAAAWSTDARLRDAFFESRTHQLYKKVVKAFSSWAQWWQPYASALPGYRPGLLPGDYASSFEVNGISVGVAGLNSAFLQLRDGDFRRKLSVDPRQLTSTMDRGSIEWTRKLDFCFLLTHHAPEWLDAHGESALRNEINAEGTFCFHLFGHDHEGDLRTHSHGGASPRVEILGRSLFGLEWIGEQKNLKRSHGFSVGRAFLSERERSFDVTPVSALEGPAGWQLVPDAKRFFLHNDRTTARRSVGQTPRQVSPTATTPVDHDRASPVSGWITINSKFIESRPESLTTLQLTRYFDGAPPGWSTAREAKVPRRAVVKEIVDDLARCNTGGVRRVSLLCGAGGEGKSTALFQAATDLSLAHGWKVLWRPDAETPLNELEVSRLAPGPWVLVSDDAERIARSVHQACRRLVSLERSDIHFLLAARDTDWRHARASGWEWGDDLRKWTFSGISEPDALAVVRAWGQAQALPPDLGSLANAETAASDLAGWARNSKAREGTFFGALLHARFDANGLRDHLRTLLQRLAGMSVGSQGATLRDALIYAAALDAIRIDGVDERLLADLLDVPRDRIRSEVVGPLCEEAAVSAGGHRISTRHPSIARTIMATVEAGGVGVEDLAETYSRVAQRAVQVGPLVGLNWEGWLASVVHMGPELVRHLRGHEITGARRLDIATRVAQAGVEANRTRLDQVVTLAATWRLGKRSKTGIEVLKAVSGDVDRFVDYAAVIRGYWCEWAMCAARGRDHGAAAMLLGYAVADLLGQPLKRDTACIAMVGLCGVFEELHARTGELLFGQGLQAAAVLGSRAGPDKTASAKFLGAPDASGAQD